VEGNEDMPMDELMDTMSVQSMPVRRSHLSHRRAASSDWTDFSQRGDSSHRRNLSMEWNTISGDVGDSGYSGHRRAHSSASLDWGDDVSSLGGVEDQPNKGLGHIIRALKHRSKSRPNNLNPEERVLWDVIQTLLNSVKSEQMSNKRALEKLLQDATRRESQLERKLRIAQKQLIPIEGGAKSRAKASHMEVQVRDLETALKTKEAEHEREVRAIQRVLAGMSEEREQERSELEKKIQSLTEAIDTLETEKDIQDIGSKSQEMASLEIEVDKMEEENEKLAEEMGTLRMELAVMKEEVVEVNKRNKMLESEMDGYKRGELPKAMTPPRPKTANLVTEESVSSEEFQSLQLSLSETKNSLENAKKIIASLENANGSLALDLRAKLKAKEQELLGAQSESSDSKRRLDILATELRDLQKRQGNTERGEKEGKMQLIKQKALLDQLEESISGLQSAAVVHEVSAATGQPDSENVDRVGEILGGTLRALKQALESGKHYVEKYGTHSGSSSFDKRNDLEQKKVARNLEDALKKQGEEMKRLRSQMDERVQGNDLQLRAEVQRLREQYSTNMEVLVKKERELSVLRSSLNVDENDAGYISDDASDEEEDESGATISSPVNYSPAAQAEALATILSHNGDVQVSPGEVEALKSELLEASNEKERASKDLQTERESLANAKMIISSLEKANKSMSEDLRSRLQDSNSTVASLMDKSMENEVSANELRHEVERLKIERDEEKKRYEAEVKKLKELNVVRSESKAALEEKKEEILGLPI
jgi:hypothetical protein